MSHRAALFPLCLFAPASSDEKPSPAFDVPSLSGSYRGSLPVWRRVVSNVFRAGLHQKTVKPWRGNFRDKPFLTLTTTHTNGRAPANLQAQAEHDARWNDHVAASPWGDVLQTLPWGEVKRPDWTPIPVSISNARDTGFDATALVLKRRLGAARCFFYVPRGPILDWQNSDATRAIFERLRLLACEHNALFLKIDPAVPASAQMDATLHELGFKPSPDAQNSFGGTQPRFNMRLDISRPLEEVMAGFHTNWRRNIRRAERDGVAVVEGSRDDLPTFHEIYKITAQRDGFTGRPLSYFHKLWDALEPRGMLKLFVARHDGQALSGAICFLLGRQCWYVYGASSNEKRNLMPNHAMQWAMMTWAKSQGCEVYDFRGVHVVQEAGMPLPTREEMMDSSDGLVKFKAGFGAQLVEYCGEWDLPLSRSGYWAWTVGRPRLVAAMKRLKGATPPASSREGATSHAG